MAVRTATGGKVDVAPNVAGTPDTPGTYTNLPEVSKWTLNPSVDAKKYASSSTAGAQKRLPGVKDFKVTIDVNVDNTSSATRFDGATLGIVEGALVWFKLYEDVGTFHVAPTYIDDITYNVDVNSGDIITATITGSSNGTLVHP